MSQTDGAAAAEVVDEPPVDNRAALHQKNLMLCVLRALENAASTIRAAFIWDTPNDRNDMNLSDACLTLEHYVDWK